MSPLNVNRVCNLEDFSDPELMGLIRGVFPRALARHPGFPARREDRKHWEIAMAIMTLRRSGALHSGAEMLGIGAGIEPTSFWLTNHVHRVFATDLYLDPGVWERNAPPGMLVDPGQFYSDPWCPARLVVSHMDARALSFGDGAFDAIFSSGSIEHFGELAEISRAMDEAFRVLKPGGVITLSTEFRLGGPAPGPIPGLALFDRDLIEEVIIGGRDWQLLDELDLTITEATRATERDIAPILADHDRAYASAQGPVQPADIELSHYPLIVQRHGPWTFTSVHLALRRSPRPVQIAVPRAADRPPLAARLAAHLPDPLVIVDAGARWGFGPHWEALGEHVTLIGFEPDAEEAARLAERYDGVLDARIIAAPLGSSTGRGTLRLFVAESSASAFPHDEEWMAPLEVPRGGDVLREIAEFEFVALDDFSADHDIQRIDALKLDVQGAELDILRGAEAMLQSVRAVELEVTFNPLFVGAPLFGEIDAFLRTRGFALWRLSDLALYPLKGADGASTRSEQVEAYGSAPVKFAYPPGLLSWGNAHFIKREALQIDSPRDWPTLLRDACVMQSLGFADLTLVALRGLIASAAPAGVRRAAGDAVSELLAAAAAQPDRGALT